MKTTPRNLSRAIFILLVVMTLFFIGLYRIEFDADIAGSLPKEPAISDAIEIFMNHPVRDQLVIDVSLQKENLDVLVECGEMVERELKDSGLFKSVGMEGVQTLIPDLVFYVLNHLPVLFSKAELNKNVDPLLTPDNVRKRFEDIYFKLSGMEGIGQAEFFSRDPLGLKDLVMAKLSLLAPSQDAWIYKGRLISSDNRHLLVIATPMASSTDSGFARLATNLIKKLSIKLNEKYAESGHHVILTPAGAYRAALDNEVIIKGDVKKALLLATIGIMLLLMVAFPRPLIGLLSFLPAIVGTMVAFFVYSLFYKTISIMVLGFGGAIISITIDHGIAYLLFLDRPHQTRGIEASHEVRAIGLIAALTTVGAFGALFFSGFPILVQLGQFAALGILFSFLFVHTVFPMILPVMPPARSRAIPLQALVNKLASSGKVGACCALFFAVAMIFYAKPEFNVSLRSMNTVSKGTMDAENLMTEVWGTIFNKIYLMTEGESVAQLQEKNDKLLNMLDQELLSDAMVSGFIPSMIFPGKNRREQNFESWKEFWNRERAADLITTMKTTALNFGFAPDGFDPFYKMIFQISDPPKTTDIPEAFLNFMGIFRHHDRPTWIQFSTLTTDKSYRAEKFYEKFSSLGKIFDPVLFSEKLGELLFSTFAKMLLIIGISVTILLFVFFHNVKLTIVALLPMVFALISTLGTLKLIGHPLDIPGLMLSIIVMGMGIDYSLFFVRSYQRYGDAAHPNFGLIRMAVFMAAVSTIIGFGVLCLAEHSLLRSAGLTSLIGIIYSLVGAFVILPPVLEYIYPVQKENIDEKGPGVS